MPTGVAPLIGSVTCEQRHGEPLTPAPTTGVARGFRALVRALMGFGRHTTNVRRARPKGDDADDNDLRQSCDSTVGSGSLHPPLVGEDDVGPKYESGERRRFDECVARCCEHKGVTVMREAIQLDPPLRRIDHPVFRDAITREHAHLSASVARFRRRREHLDAEIRRMPDDVVEVDEMPSLPLEIHDVWLQHVVIGEHDGIAD
jgi:hypothetical protein